MTTTLNQTGKPLIKSIEAYANDLTPTAIASMDRVQLATTWLECKAAEKVSEAAMETAKAKREEVGRRAGQVFTKDELVVVRVNPYMIGQQTIRYACQPTGGQAAYKDVCTAIAPLLTPEQRVVYDAAMAAAQGVKGVAHSFKAPTAAQLALRR